MMNDIFRVENNVPSVYCNESRDFQLLCRLFTACLANVKYDIDSISYLTDSERCKSTVIPLLQTKLGFFTSNTYSDETLRIILSGFPTIVRNKGSLKALQQVMNIFFKIFNVRSSVIVQYTNVGTTVYGTPVQDHTIIIGINSFLKPGGNVLKDMLRYVIPTGYGLYLYYYQSIEDITELLLADNAILLFASDSVNSDIRTKLQNEFSPDGLGLWTADAVKCSDPTLTVNINWDTFISKVKDSANFVYTVYTFVSSGTTASTLTWKLNNTTVVLSDYGITLSYENIPAAGTTIKVALLVDELIGAVDTASFEITSDEEGE